MVGLPSTAAEPKFLKLRFEHVESAVPLFPTVLLQPTFDRAPVFAFVVVAASPIRKLVERLGLPPCLALDVVHSSVVDRVPFHGANDPPHGGARPVGDGADGRIILKVLEMPEDFFQHVWVGWLLDWDHGASGLGAPTIRGSLARNRVSWCNRGSSGSRLLIYYQRTVPLLTDPHWHALASTSNSRSRPPVVPAYQP